MNFEKAIKAAVTKVPEAGRFGNKVFISALWATAALEMDLSEFKARLVELNSRRAVSLARADLVGAMDPWMVKRSYTTGPAGSEFHFMVVR
jgi:hypothetical protein